MSGRRQGRRSAERRLGLMANTSYYKTHVEPFVRGELQRLHARHFSSEVIRLPTGGTHEFDAVADDRSIIASIKSLSGKTASGKMPAGKYASCLAELYFLMLTDAPRRMLVLTTPSLHTMFAKYMQGRLHPDLEIELIVVPPEIQAEIDRIRDIASGEVSPL